MRKSPITSEILDRQPPCNVEAEHCVLGSILILPDVIDAIAARVQLRPDDFYDDANATVYRAMLAMHDAGRKIDVTLLIAEMEKAGDFERIGGPSYLARVTNSVPNAAHAVHYAQIVREKSKRRALINLYCEGLQAAYDDTVDVDDLVAAGIGKLDRISANGQVNTLVTADEAFAEAIKNAQAAGNQGAATGIPSFDRKYGGFHAGELIVLAARPSMGKSAFACQIAMTHATSRQRVLFASLEMSAAELGGRTIASYAGVDGNRLRNGTADEMDFSMLHQAAEKLSGLPLQIIDQPDLSVPSLAAIARRLHRQDPLSLLVVDYLGRLSPSDRRVPRREQVGEMIRSLKQLARQLDVPVLCLSQLNREVESATDHIPKLSHLRESGDIEQEADVVLFLHRPEAFRPKDGDLKGKAQLIVAKNRNGQTGSVTLVWLPETTEFRDLSPHHEEDRF